MCTDGDMKNDCDSEPPPSKRRRGFALMSVEERRRIASMGGQAAHARGTAHEFSQEEARTAGRAGGRAVSEDREHMTRIGRRGGEQRGVNLRARNETAPPLAQGVVLPLFVLLLLFLFPKQTEAQPTSGSSSPRSESMTILPAFGGLSDGGPVLSVCRVWGSSCSD